MKVTKVLALFAVISYSAFGVYKVGDKVENLCWQDNNNKQVCMDDFPGNVKVLLYNAGWCPPCNKEFEEISPAVSKYEGQNVTFISLSCSGWSQGQKPDSKFLNEWKNKFNIPFVVAASPKDCGKQFITGTVYIPNVAILNANRVLTYQAINPGVDAIFNEVDDLVVK